MSTNKHACFFPDCPRRFDRYKRLQEHFQDHLMNNLHPNGQRRRASDKSSRAKNQDAARRRSRKSRSSNLRKQYVVYASGRCSRDAPSSSRTAVMVDLRTPSLSPDTLTDTDTNGDGEGETQGQRQGQSPLAGQGRGGGPPAPGTPTIPIMPIFSKGIQKSSQNSSQTLSQRKGPSWVTSSPSPEANHPALPKSKHHDDGADVTADASQKQEGNQQPFNEDADDEDDDDTQSQTARHAFVADQEDSVTGERGRPDINENAQNKFHIGDLGGMGQEKQAEEKEQDMDIDSQSDNVDMEEAEHQLQLQPTVDTLPFRVSRSSSSSLFATPINKHINHDSPFSMLSTGAPKAGESSGPPRTLAQIPNDQYGNNPTRDSNVFIAPTILSPSKATTPLRESFGTMNRFSEGDGLVFRDVPNSLDRAIRAAELALRDDSREQTPCPESRAHLMDRGDILQPGRSVLSEQDTQLSSSVHLPVVTLDAQKTGSVALVVQVDTLVGQGISRLASSPTSSLTAKLRASSTFDSQTSCSREISANHDTYANADLHDLAHATLGDGTHADILLAMAKHVIFCPSLRASTSSGITSSSTSSSCVAETSPSPHSPKERHKPPPVNFYKNFDMVDGQLDRTKEAIKVLSSLLADEDVEMGLNTSSAARGRDSVGKEERMKTIVAELARLWQIE